VRARGAVTVIFTFTVEPSGTVGFALERLADQPAGTLADSGQARGSHRASMLLNVSV
jgi:hypothetical protein